MGLSAGGWGAHTCYAGAPEGRAPLLTLSALLQVPPPQMSFTSSVRSQILIKQLPLMCNKQITMKNLPVLFFHSELLDWVSSVWCGVSNSACFLLSSFRFGRSNFFIISCSRSPSRVLIFLYSSSPTLLLQFRAVAGYVFIHPSHTFLSLYMFPSSLLLFIFFSFSLFILFHYLFLIICLYSVFLSYFMFLYFFQNVFIYILFVLLYLIFFVHYFILFYIV